MSIKIVNTVRTGIVAVYHQLTHATYFKAPWLAVVAAGRPARLIEDIFQHGIHRCKRSHSCPLGGAAAPDNGHRQPLQRMAVAARTPGMHKLVTVSIEMQATRRRPHLAAPQQNFHASVAATPAHN